MFNWGELGEGSAAADTNCEVGMCHLFEMATLASVLMAHNDTNHRS